MNKCKEAERLVNNCGTLFGHKNFKSGFLFSQRYQNLVWSFYVGQDVGKV